MSIIRLQKDIHINFLKFITSKSRSLYSVQKFSSSGENLRQCKIYESEKSLSFSTNTTNNTNTMVNIKLEHNDSKNML